MNGKTLIFTLIACFAYFGSIKAQTDVYKLQRVVIDAGHGGKDPGAVGYNNIYEKNIVLPIALKLGAIIKKKFPDIDVIYTRDDDFFVELNKRGEIANNRKADLFISIHANSNPYNKKRKGSETYVMGLDAQGLNFEVAKRENSVIIYEEDYIHKYEGYDVQNPETLIVLNLIQNAFQEQSLIIATKVQQQLVKFAKRHDGGVHQAGFVVLWDTNMPSILVETGYISNAEEAKYLSGSTGQATIAQAIFNAFVEYKTIVEQKSRFSEDLIRMQSSKTIEYKSEKHGSIKTEKIIPVVNSKNKIKEKNNTAIHFEVQICSSNKPLPENSPLFKGFKNVREYRHNGAYKYTVGNSISYDKIIELQNKVQKTISGAFVVAFDGDKRIAIHEALSHINK